ncbi:preprotein translocase subunit YajC [uncultured Tenacibaculum sp.]|uniref:preprotein translocase subunit YajC n=1 Tax=uncultured Tenacibaculum sp. TaxID=174713 RepID=UPI00261AB2C4|nr:preprotein translocase subunit YajC [uncultured Tenacibaculum sp.]
MFNMIFLQASEPGMMNMLMLVAFIAVFYFFMIRPQMAKQKKEKQFRTEIKKGAKVVTTSGIHGKISEINDTNNTVVIETGAGKIRFERAAISMELTNKYSEKK